MTTTAGSPRTQLMRPIVAVATFLTLPLVSLLELQLAYYLIAPLEQSGLPIHQETWPFVADLSLPIHAAAMLIAAIVVVKGLSSGWKIFLRRLGWALLASLALLVGSLIAAMLA